jgi:hypothetical protein
VRIEPSGEEIQALIDGELSQEDAARVRSALACSGHALLELDECMQMAALAFELRQQAREQESAVPIDKGRRLAGPSNVIPMQHRIRRQPKTLMAVVASLAMAGAAAMWIFRPADPSGPVLAVADPARAFAAALSPRRAMAPRLSWPGADHHRPYDTARAGGTGERPAETLSFELLASVEKLDDPRAMAAARILRGDTAEARNQLVLAKRSPDADSDRAAIALVEGKAEDALLAASAAVESDPRHVQATWNRALALERLGMPLTAAEAFKAVAARREPGWSQEASDRATALRAQFQRRKSAWEAAGTAGTQLVAGDMVDDATLAAYPSLMRRFFYDAVRTAGSADRVKALRPIAATLDARFGGSHLTAYLDRIAKSDFRRRAPLAARYAVLARRELKDPAAVQDLVKDLRAAGQKDMLLGALLHASPTDWRPNKEQLNEYLALARATDDPWFQLEAEINRGWHALWVPDIPLAQTVLDGAAARCDTDTFDELCLDVFRLLTHAYLKLHRAAPASRALDRARELGRVSGNVSVDADLLWYAHLVITYRDHVSANLVELAIAYLDESNRESTECADVVRARDWKASALINQRRLDEARRELGAGSANTCEAPLTVSRASAMAHVLSDGGSVAAVRALQGDLAALRASATITAGERVFLDHLEGRLLVQRDPAQGRVFLRRAIEAAGALPADNDALRAASYSYSVLIEEAAARAASDEVMALLAEDLGLPAPERCALGASAENSVVFAARDTHGKTIGGSSAVAPGEPLGARPVPDAIRAALVGCDMVDVYARQPYYGQPDLLPRDMAWQFRTGAPATAASASPPAPGRHVVVANIVPPPGLDLPPLRPVAEAQGTTLIEGPAATPGRVMAAAADASFLEIHAHGLLGRDVSDTSLLVLAPDAKGRHTLAGDEIRRARLRGAPVVVLAACHASAIVGAFHSTWGLADAFAEAGASAVIASPDVIQDAGAAAFFGSLRQRIAAGQPPAAALRAERMARTDSDERTWIDRLVVFR